MIWIGASLMFGGVSAGAAVASVLWRRRPWAFRLHWYVAGAGMASSVLTLLLGMIETSYRWRSW